MRVLGLTMNHENATETRATPHPLSYLPSACVEGYFSREGGLCSRSNSVLRKDST